MLERWGIQYQDTNDADLLLQLLEQKQQSQQLPQAVIIGLSRQELYAPETKKLFKNIGRFNVPIIALTNSAVFDELEYIQSIGAYHALSKPVESTKLFNTLCEATGNEDYLASSSSSDMINANTDVPRILAVDDNEANLKLITTLLEEIGVAVLGAHSGQEALTLLEDQTVDLIFMDIQMPGMNGLETTQLIRQKHNQSSLPIIALTAHAMADEKEALINVGMNDYQTKPISTQQLQQCISHWTGYKCNSVTPKKLYLLKSQSKPGKDIERLDSCRVFNIEAALQRANYKKDLACEMFRMLIEG